MTVARKFMVRLLGGPRDGDDWVIEGLPPTIRVPLPEPTQLRKGQSESAPPVARVGLYRRDLASEFGLDYLWDGETRE